MTIVQCRLATAVLFVLFTTLTAVHARLGSGHKSKRVAGVHHRRKLKKDDEEDHTYSFAFVSSRTYEGGDFGQGDDEGDDKKHKSKDKKEGELLAWADGECQDMADQAGLFGTYLAWLSDESDSPSTRFEIVDSSGGDDHKKKKGDHYFVMPDENEMVVATGWSMLTSGKLSNPLVYDENGNRAEPGYVWTGTTVAGQYSGASCNNWESDESDQYATVGEVGMIFNGDWTAYDTARCDGTMFRIYCFQDHDGKPN